MGVGQPATHGQKKRKQRVTGIKETPTSSCEMADRWEKRRAMDGWEKDDGRRRERREG